MAKLRGLAEVVLSVRDLERSVRFYRDVLQLQVISPPDMKGPVYLQVGDDREVVHQIVLAPLPREAPDFPAQRPHRQMRHFAIEIPEEEFDRQRQRLESLGLEVRLGDHPFLPLKGLYVDDPDGNEIELMARRS